MPLTKREEAIVTLAIEASPNYLGIVMHEQETVIIAKLAAERDLLKAQNEQNFKNLNELARLSSSLLGAMRREGSASLTTLEWIRFNNLVEFLRRNIPDLNPGEYDSI